MATLLLSSGGDSAGLKTPPATTQLSYGGQRLPPLPPPVYTLHTHTLSLSISLSHTQTDTPRDMRPVRH